MNHQLLAKFLSGRCTPEEYQKVIVWSKGDTVKSDLETLLEQAWKEQPSTYLEHDPDKVFSAIMSKASATETQTAMPLKNPTRRYLKYAAAVLLVLTVAWGWMKFNSHGIPTVNEVVLLSTKKGQKKTFLLSDGSKVVLNASSTLQFDKNFSDSSRILHLTGEGYFEVAKDAQRPFSVVAQKVVTTALGTEFNINERDLVEISLNEGRVSVRKDDSTIEQQWVLSPGEKITYDERGNYFEREPFQAEQVLAWTEGKLIFTDAPFDEVLWQLELWYDVSFELAGPTIAKTYSGSFDNESLDNVLKGMSFSLDFEYHIQDGLVTIQEKKQ